MAPVDPTAPVGLGAGTSGVTISAATKGLLHPHSSFSAQAVATVRSHSLLRDISAKTAGISTERSTVTATLVDLNPLLRARGSFGLTASVTRGRGWTPGGCW